MSIQVLDCTLRDGGYINDWRFGRKAIAEILRKLELAHVDIIECGFLTGMLHDPESALFPDPTAIERLLPEGRHHALFVAMIAIGEKELHPDRLPPCSNSGIGGIRLTFHKEEINQALEWAEILKQKGYRVFMQPVGTMFYTDLELLRLVEKINTLRPYAFYIVDTLGSMYRSDVSHRFYLIDKNMDPAIHLGFHGHNNLQLAFSNAQVLMKIPTRRTLILDSSVYGMGRGAGNLPTELICEYINRTVASRYDVSTVMDLYDEYISEIRKTHEWGYTLPYYLAAENLCHPNYAAFLINKQTLTMKDIQAIICSIPAESRILYDSKLIEQLYAAFQSCKIDDSPARDTLMEKIRGRKILLLAPGNSLVTEYNHVRRFIETENPYVITLNFADGRFGADACFICSHRRMEAIARDVRQLPKLQVILTSNVQNDCGRDVLYVDYDNYVNDDRMVSDNAALMMLHLLRRCGVRQVFLAGFDGSYLPFHETYYREELHDMMQGDALLEKQHRVKEQLKKLENVMQFSFLTPSIYESEDSEHV